MSATHQGSDASFETLCAHIAAGSMAAAAHELGVTETTARQHLSGLYRRTGCLDAAQVSIGPAGLTATVTATAMSLGPTG